MSDYQLGHRIIRTGNQIIRYNDRIFSPYGLTGKQARLILYIAHHKNGMVLQREIEDELGIRKSSVSSVIHNLEHNGFITKVNNSKDNRSNQIILTDKGFDMDIIIQNKIEEFETRLKRDLSDDEKETFIKLLNKISNNIE